MKNEALRNELIEALVEAQTRLCIAIDVLQPSLSCLAEGHQRSVFVAIEGLKRTLDRVNTALEERRSP